MNAVDHVCTRIFDFFLVPLDRIGFPCGLLVASAVFGILALIAFKFLSAQKRIKSVKNRIKGHLIEIRIYQDDLGIVGQAIGKVLLRNFQYLALNFAPFVPLSIPFTLVIAQLAVRYGFEPVRVHAAGEHVLPGRGAMIEVELARGRAADVTGLRFELPQGVRAISPLVRRPSDGIAYQEVVADAPVEGVIGVVLADGSRVTKAMTAGVRGTSIQPERSRGFFGALLWPAEDGLASDSPFERVRLEYPERTLGWFPDGPTGVLLVFLVASMVAGVLVLKPLRIQI